MGVIRLSRRWFTTGLFVVGVLILLSAGGIFTMSKLEEQDRFCGSCHMAPERTYFNRAQFALAGSEPLTDLASAHYAKGHEQLGRDFHCIDCHRGDAGLKDRTDALTLGARDAAVYFFGKPDQTIEKGTLADPALLNDSCLSCHSDTILVAGFQNHYHNKLPISLQLWNQGQPMTMPPDVPESRKPIFEQQIKNGPQIEDIDIHCLDCHVAHITIPGGEDTTFIDVHNIVFPTCERCHTEAIGQPLGLDTQQP